MIQKALIIGLLCMTAITGNSQEVAPYKPSFAFGGSVGATLSSVSFVPKVKNSMLMGFTAGITGRYDSERNVGIQAELNFAQQGWDETFIDPKYQYSRVINYIELPILTHIYFGRKRVKFFLNLGPKIGYSFSESSVSTDNFDKMDTNIEGNHLVEQHKMAVQNKLDWGICGGPGIELRTGIGYFLLEGRYYYGLGDIFKSRKEDYFAQSSPQIISAKVTYLIPFKK